MNTRVSVEDGGRSWNRHDAGEWMIRARPGKTSPWFAEAKRKAGPFLEHGLLEPDDVDIYFTFGATEADVVRKLKRESAALT